MKHTSGSMSLLLDTGEAFVGDLVMNSPVRIGPGLPIYADNMDHVKESIKILLDNGAKMFYPSHGNSFRAEILKSVLISKDVFQ